MSKHKKFKFICDKCRNEFEISDESVKNRKKNNTPNYCKECLKEYSRDKSIEYWSNLSDEGRKKHNKKVKDSINNMPEEKKKEIYEKRKINHLEFWNNMSDNDRKEFGNKIKNGWTDEKRLKQSEIRKNVINNMGREEKEKWVKNLSEATKKWWDKQSDEYKLERHNQLYQGLLNYWNLMDEDDHLNHNKKVSDGLKKYWETHPDMKKILSQIQFEYYSDPKNRETASKIRKEWWNNLTEEQRKHMSQIQIDNYNNLSEEEKERRRQRGKNQWNNMTDDQLREWNNKRVHGISINGINLEDKFADYLQLYQLKYERQYSNRNKHPLFDLLFDINPITGSNNVSVHHKWDFVILYDNKKVLIDIDGSIHNVKENEIIINGMDIGLYTQWLDIKREYCTDDYDAFIVEAYDNDIDKNTMVKCLKDNVEISLEDFLTLLKEYK